MKKLNIFQRSHHYELYLVLETEIGFSNNLVLK
jgi:hypothetical protein